MHSWRTSFTPRLSPQAPRRRSYLHDACAASGRHTSSASSSSGTPPRRRSRARLHPSHPSRQIASPHMAPTVSPSVGIESSAPFRIEGIDRGDRPRQSEWSPLIVVEPITYGVMGFLIGEWPIGFAGMLVPAPETPRYSCRQADRSASDDFGVPQVDGLVPRFAQLITASNGTY